MNHLLSVPRLLASLVLVACSGMFAPAAIAQPAGAQGENFLYRVIKDDTLIMLSERFTDSTERWRTLQTLNTIDDPTRLPIGLELKIPFALIPEQAAQAQVVHVTGTAYRGRQKLAVGDQLAEGDTISTGANGFATLSLPDGTTLTVPAQSSLRLERLRVFKGTGLTDTISTLNDGSLESQVAPQGTGVGRFEIRSPVSITGVRGTQLRVHVNQQGSQSEVLEGVAGLNSQQAESTRLRQGQGAAVNSSGELQAVRSLLPAPALPTPERADSGWQLSFPAVPGARSYLVRVAGDPQGTKLFSSQLFDTPNISFRAPGAGTYYVMVRGIDAEGLNGADAIQPFLGSAVLKVSDGGPVSTPFGLFVTLTDY
ncbi:FecR domain-containing protein [Pollutimonas harenae]|uniref:FecR domain-containing protein n=1 Tax=Pollutimonas harenae TaxID=657015 RepID=A0A853H4B1_9BURK|nr:FecR domain-containing protein [Pollutimonas harenae]NYT87052.1 FecR domain-containing protein [Pollutimonas harenae]TEA72975.1 peptidoglycan-binding protein [Pollutimonas harenae]